MVIEWSCCCFFFFFQAEDGIRDKLVTGVQTCALPIYFSELVVKPLLMVIFALLGGAAWSKAEKPEKFLIPMLISIWVMGSMVIVFVYLSGVTLGELASSTSREFLSSLGMHANALGRMYEVAYALP